MAIKPRGLGLGLVFPEDLETRIYVSQGSEEGRAGKGRMPNKAQLQQSPVEGSLSLIPQGSPGV